MRKRTGTSCLAAAFVICLLWISGCGEDAGSGQPLTIEVSRHFVTTEDDVEITLFRYARSDDYAAADPILLCPGFSENHLAFDLTPDSSMSRTLAAEGIETWAIDFRGRGESGVPEGTAKRVAPWSIDDFGYLDIAAAVAYIRDRSPSGHLYLLGFSEGDAASTAFLLEGEADAVRGHISLAPGIVLGTTTDNPDGTWPPVQLLFNVLHFVEPIIPRDLFIPFPELVQAVYRIVVDLGLEEWALQLEFWNILWNMENMTDDRVRDTLFHVLGDISSNIFKQFLRGTNPFDRKGVCTFEGSALEEHAGPFCYQDRLGELQVPTLVLAGNKDRAVPPVNARHVFDLLGSPDKTFRILGQEYGDTFDYGHDDLTFGVHAADDVYPAIAEWILERK